MTLFFLSDTHFSHENIIGYCGRPFASAEEMDEAIVERWNARVRPGDHVYHLGDVALRRQHLGIVKRLSGRKRLLFGNHDIFDYKDYVAAGFEKLAAYRVLDGLMFSHIPIAERSLGRFAANVHGHTHNNEVDPNPRYFNACVEVLNYTPVSLEEIKATLRTRGVVAPSLKPVPSETQERS